jgi:hypothetical protein
MIKTAITLWLIWFPLATHTAVLPVGPSLTNDVRIRGDMFLGITDDIDKPDESLMAKMKDMEVAAQNNLYYAIQHRGTNLSEVVIFAKREEMPFEFSLTDSNLHLVSKTDKGLAAATISSASIPLGKKRALLKHLEPGPRGSQVYALFKVLEMFDVHSPGLYVLELRLRWWLPEEREYKLMHSLPIRLRVVVREEDLLDLKKKQAQEVFKETDP